MELGVPGALNPIGFYMQKKQEDAGEDADMEEIKKNLLSTFYFSVRKIIDDLEDVSSKMVYEHALGKYKVLTETNQYTREEYLNLVKNGFSNSEDEDFAARKSLGLTEEDEQSSNTKRSLFLYFQQYLRDTFMDSSRHTLKLTSYYLGNIDKLRAYAMTQKMKSYISANEKNFESANQMLQVQKSLPVQKASPSILLSSAQAKLFVPATRHLVLNIEKPIEVRLRNPIGAKDDNHAVVNLYQWGIPTVKERVELALLSNLVDRKIFDFLRTDHQLGYIVSGGVRPHLNVAELYILVQGVKSTPFGVEKLIDELIPLLRDIVNDLEEDDFEKRRVALLTNLKKPASNQNEQAHAVWNKVWDEDYCFGLKASITRFFYNPSQND